MVEVFQYSFAIKHIPVAAVVVQVSVLILLLVSPPPMHHTDGGVLTQGLVGLRLKFRIGGGYLDVLATNILNSLTGNLQILQSDPFCSIMKVPVTNVSSGFQAVVGLVIFQVNVRDRGKVILRTNPGVPFLVEVDEEVSP